MSALNPLSGMVTPETPRSSLHGARSGQQSLTEIQRTIQFTVPGKPAPQGSKRHVGHGRMIESSREVGPWRERVALVAHNAMLGQDLLAGAVAVSLAFTLPRPKSTPKSYTPNAIKRPDLDKLARAILDAITSTIIDDDSQVIQLTATKRIAEVGETPHVRIQVTTV